MRTTERRAGIACVAALVASIVWVYAPGQTSLTAHHDNLDGTAPLRVEAARQWRSGRVPLWNPWKRSGMPLLADTTAGTLYPGNAPFLFLGDEAAPDGGEGSPVFRALDRVATINAVLGGVFIYVFLRSLLLAPLAATFGGLVFACSGTMGWFAAWYMQIQSSVVWLPLVLAAVLRAGGVPRALGAAASDPDGLVRVSEAPAATSADPGATIALWTTIGAIAVALQFFAGFPETSFYSGVLAIAWALRLAVSQGSVRPVAAVAVIYTAGMLLAAIQLVPSLELQSMSRRPGALSLEVFQSLPASIDMVRSWAMPPGPAGFEFPPLAAYHFGAVATLAALAGAIGFFRRSAFFLAVLAIGLVLSLGSATPVNAWLHALPGFSAFRHPFKHLFEVSFAMSVLAAFGAQLVVGRADDARSPLRAGAAAFAIVATCVLLRANLATIAAANPAGVDTSGAAPAIAAKIEAGWRVLTPRRVFQKRDPELLIGDYPSQFRVAAVHGAGPFLWSAMAEAAGMVEEETKFRPGLFEAHDRTLALLSGRYLVQTKEQERFTPVVDPSAWSVASETAGARLVERRDALARLRFVGAARCGSEAEIRASLEGRGDDPGAVALVDCSSSFASPTGPFHPPASLSPKIEHESPGALVLETDVPEGASAFLVVGQSDFPGWHAGVDGHRVAVRRVHGLVQGLELPPGAKRVELRYMPLSFLAGCAMSGATLVVLLLWCLVSRQKSDLAA
jgi:hypothetical protein